MGRRKAFSGAVAALWLLLAAIAAAAADDPLKGCREHIRYGEPLYVAANPNAVRLCRLGYALSHNSGRKVPDWVAWHLSRPKALGCLPRKNAFAADRDLKKGKRAELADYKNRGYDRGHIAPNADFLWSTLAQKETFRLSNMTPQLHAFNAGIWSRLEELTRVWATERGEVFVISGALYEGAVIQKIGANNVNVPTNFYKIIFDPEAREALAFIFPHGQISPNALGFFQKSAREVEQRSGLNFLSALFQEIQDNIETKRPTIWAANLTAWRQMKKEHCASQ